MSRFACLMMVLTLGATGCSMSEERTPHADAGAVVQSTTTASAEPTEKPTEVELLKHRLAMASGRQMQTIFAAAYKYAQAHEGTFPTKPSDLKEAFGEDGWRQFIAPYEYDETFNKIILSKDHWASVDELGSYEFVPAKFREDKHVGKQLVLKEQQSIYDNKRWYFFDDGHGQLTDEAGVKDWTSASR